MPATVSDAFAVVSYFIVELEGVTTTVALHLMKGNRSHCTGVDFVVGTCSFGLTFFLFVTV